MNTKSGAFVFFCCAVCFCWRVCIPPSSIYFTRCDSHGSTSAALQGLLFVTATNTASVCAILNTIWTILTHTAEFQKHPRRKQTVQHQQNTSGEFHIGSYTYHKNPGAPPFQHPRDFKQPLPEGESCILYISYSVPRVGKRPHEQALRSDFDSGLRTCWGRCC